MSDEKKAIEFVTRQVDGADKIFASFPWPEITEVMPDQLESLPAGLAVLDGDNLTVTVANGSAQYLKTATAEDGLLTFEPVESTFEPLEADAPIPDPVPAAADELLIDTTAQEQPHTDYVREPRKTFGQVLSAETAAAFKSGDMTLHASIHNFEIAAGDFKRAAVQLEKTLPAESELGDVLRSIISDL